MVRLIAVAAEKKMPFMQLVGDQPVYALLVQLRNENPERFKRIIPVLGPFHTQISFITAITQRFEGSGIKDMIVSAEIIAEKSVEGALRGKHFRRIVRALQLIYESLQRRIIRNGISQGLLLSKHIQDQLKCLRNPDQATTHDLQNAIEEIKGSEEFKNFMMDAYKIIKNYHSPMADYWLSYMDMVEILMMNIHSLKTKDWHQFKASLRLMIPWLKIYDKNHYGKWLVEFWTEMSSLSDEFVSHMEKIFSQSITGKPYSCLPMDLWIEMTMNRGSKMKAGWKNILKNETMLHTHTMNANFVNKIRISLHKVANLKHSNSTHKENTKTRLKLDEIAVQDLDSCIVEFECDPFNPSNVTLRSLQSGITATPKLQQDFTSAHEDGEALTEIFFKERIFSRDVGFDKIVHKNSRKTFTNPPSSGESSFTAKSKTAVMENEAMSQVVSLCLGQKVTLIDVMYNRVTEECLSIFNTNGAIVKVQKSKLLELFKFVPLNQGQLERCISLIDMGFYWRLATPSAEDREKNDESLYTWKDYANKVFNLIITRHNTASLIILVNDPYDVAESIKDAEHARRANNDKFTAGSKNVFIRPHDKLPNSRDFSTFFKNKGNKKRLQEFLRTEFHHLAQNIPLRLIYSLQKHCTDVSTGERYPQFECEHTEADTIIFYICSQLRKTNQSETIVVDAEDTDAVALAAKVSHKLSGVMGIRRKKMVFDCKQLCSPEIASIIVQFHVQTGADAISGFYGHGKKSISKQVLKDEAALNLLSGVGLSLPMTESIVKDLERMTIRYIYFIFIFYAALDCCFYHDY